MKPPATISAPVCGECGDRHYLLENVDGRARARLCPGFQCTECDGQGRQFVRDAAGREILKNCNCAPLRARVALFNASGIPGKFAAASFDTFNTDKRHPSLALALTRARNFARDFAPGCRSLVFSGAPGLGKTHLAAAIISSLILERGIACKFVDFFQLLSDIRHAYSEDRSDQSVINPYVQSGVLVIDELAKGRNTEWELTVLDQIIAARYNSANQVTLFTTNYQSESAIKPEEGAHARRDAPGNSLRTNFADLLQETLQERIGARIYSRLAEMCDFVMMQGEDYRQQKLPPTQRFPRPPTSRRK